MAIDPISVSVENNLGELVKALDGLSGQRINSIIAATLTSVAAEGQKEFRKQVLQVFDRPKPFTVNATFIKRATPQRLSAEVGFREFAGKGVAAGKYLLPQIYGGSRANKRSENALQRIGLLPTGYKVTPGPGAKIDAFGNQAASEVVQILSALKAFNEVGFQANRTEQSKQRRGKRLRQFFAVGVDNQDSRLSPGVYQRKASGITKVMNFVREPKYQVRLPIGDIIGNVIKRDFERIFIIQAERSIERLRARLSNRAA